MKITLYKSDLLPHLRETRTETPEDITIADFDSYLRQTIRTCELCVYEDEENGIAIVLKSRFYGIPKKEKDESVSFGGCHSRGG